MSCRVNADQDASAMALEVAIERFLTHKRALNRRYAAEEKVLRLFARVLSERGVFTLDDVTTDAVHAFVLERPRARPRGFNALLSVLERFFAFLQQQELMATSPLRLRHRRVTEQRIPFIFDRDDARRLLQVAAALPDTNRARRRGPTYMTIFALMYGLGLRVSEAANLSIADVDLQRDLLIVRDSKFMKSRLLPFGPRLRARLATFIDQSTECAAGRDAQAPLFTFSRRRPIYAGTISDVFHELLPHLHLTLADGVASPSTHSLRHSFAVGTLLRWYRAGINPSDRLLHLSTFMGHSDITSTSTYLTITDQLLNAATERFTHYAATHATATNDRGEP